MPPNRSRSPARLFAPAALLAIMLAIALIVLGSGGQDGASTEKTDTAGPQSTTPKRANATERPRERASYTVKPGDTLGGIGQKTGVDVEALQELNPSLDPQALVSGQKIKLRK